MRVIVTGGCGFIGSHFIRHILAAYPSSRITNIDSLTYAAHPDTVDYLARLAPPRYELARMDIASPEIPALFKKVKPDVIVNFAAESHVDRSILDPERFIRTNVLGVQNLLGAAKELGKVRFVHVSTDEVYGTLTPTDLPFTEKTSLDPNSPYAASKASADLLALANCRTFKQDIVITRCSNNYGPFQFPEKLLPLVLANAIEDRPVPIYGDGRQVRDWIYVDDHCSAIAKVMEEGITGEVYNISAESERFNIDVVKELLSLVGKPHSLIQHVGDRPAHDRRYALDSSKIRRELGWVPAMSFTEGLAKTVRWYIENKPWWEKVRGKDYFNYYQANYGTKAPEVTI